VRNLPFKPESYRKSISRIAGIASATTAAVLTLATGAQAAGPTISATPQKMPTFNGGVYAMAYDGNTLYVGGAFTSVNYGGAKVARVGLAAINASTGALLSWAPTEDGQVNAMAIDTTTHHVYIGGTFATINGTKRDSLAEIDGGTGVLGSFKHGVTGAPYVLAVGHGRLYLGGHITAIDSSARTNLAAFVLSSGALDTGWAPTADDVVYSLYSDTNRIYIGGKFHKINSISGTGKLAAVDPATAVRDGSFKPSVDVVVYGIAVGAGSVWASLGGTGGRTISLTPTGALQWTFQTDGDQRSLSYLNGVLYIGGHFDHACSDTNVAAHGVCLDGSISRIKFAAVDASTGVITDWNPSGNGIHGVFVAAVNPSLGTIAAGGEFTTIGGVSHGRFAQFH
jgi:hypothetical protein